MHVGSDGAEAISYIKGLDTDSAAHHLDLVISDMHLPKRNGEEIFQCLRSTERFRQVPVIVMTSAGSAALPESASEHPVMTYFRKPFALQEFLQLGATARRTLGLGEDITSVLHPFYQTVEEQA